ncbi:MAG TPA: DNA-processing protein DprA [Candidatus Acidoferrales bacterium]|nr:DNA-processing protein DprA [Candidatus Acidoferrales bacterium]
MDSELEAGYLLAVAGAAVWTPRPLVAALRELGSARALVEFAREPLHADATPRERLGAEALARIAAIDDAAARDAFRMASRPELRFVSSTSPGYPRRLLELCDPPPVLYYRGKLDVLEGRAIAIVGCRACTPYGRSMSAQLVRGFSSFGATIVSGLARGIDAAAHRAAIAATTPTVAAIGSGLLALYPPYHSLLADEIVARGGAVISEFPLKMVARQHHFPMRNRLVAALADATVVVEAGARSGALITARLAAETGRHVFAVPGDVGRTASEGSNALIKDGVALTTGADDVAALLGWTRQLRDSGLDDEGAARRGAVASSGADLLEALAHGACDVDELCAATGLDAASVSAQLTLLEMQGLVDRAAGGIFRPT